jgi:ABC-type branched-subunit amino acid transport system ATPase component
LSTAPLLAVEGLVAGYGRIRVLDGVTLRVEEGACVGILGHNGMGKSTLLKAIVGQIPAVAGSITWRGRAIGHEPAHVRARLGFGYVPQGRQIFPALSVEENLRFAAVARGKPLSTVEAVLADFPELGPLRGRLGGSLSGGEQQLLALARALCGEPALLLLDEPTEGIQPSILQTIAVRLDELRRRGGLAVLVVEQNLDFIRSAADRVLLIQRGRITATLPRAALGEPDLAQEFLGVTASRRAALRERH